MLTWRRKLTRHYSRRDLKCFMGVLTVLVTTTVIMLIRSQYYPQGKVNRMLPLDSWGGAEDKGGEVVLRTDDQTWREKVEEQRTYTIPDPLPQDTSYLRAFTSPYISNADARKLYDDFKLPKEAKKNVTGKKIITWYASASERLREDLFDDDVFDECPVARCKFVRPETLQEKPDRAVDAIIFPGTAGREKPPLRRTHPDQVFIYYDLDPPLRPTQAFGSREWNSVFNWTWSYRQDADIWEPAGTLKKTGDKVKPLSFYKDLAKEKSKNKHVAWFVNTCQVPSQRERYVQELQKHVNVDVYGRCGNKTCPKSFECLQMLTQKYFFYLSFESALCKDYVTDKFLHMFLEDIHVVPVVMGGAEYRSFFAEGTYIDVSWFPSPKQLGEFLRLLMDDRKVYAQFLWRKSHFLFAGTSTTSALCQLCQRLHDPRTYRKTYPDLQNWYRNKQCRAPRKLY
ncbi:alpha-(1,3)-fucosyltransferase C-like isoform X2 [Babylonia areolata]|uniref:alpha-(1,3)-fucosyltransferase C-like isoform X2 n=1 Tax=Babylonia areolata TaxID=304850 RepID=UPI003FD5C7C0